MAEKLRPGLAGEAREIVGQTNLASSYAPSSVDLYATPAMIGLMEHAAINAVNHLLAEGSTSVGTLVQVQHLAATPPGLEVRARAELVEVDGRALKFRVEAFDPVEKIGEGTHERFVVELGRLVARAQTKVSPEGS